MIDIVDLNSKFSKYNMVASFDIQLNTSRNGYDLSLKLTEDEFFDGEYLQVVFYDVSDLSISDFGGGLNQFMDLTVEKDLRGLEKVNYTIFPVENENVAFKCSKILASVDYA